MGNGDGAVLVQEACDGVGVGERASDVAARREGSQHGMVGILRRPQRSEVPVGASARLCHHDNRFCVRVILHITSH